MYYQKIALVVSVCALVSTLHGASRRWTQEVKNALSPWTGFALLCGYAVVLVAVAAWRLRRGDA